MFSLINGSQRMGTHGTNRCNEHWNTKRGEGGNGMRGNNLPVRYNEHCPGDRHTESPDFKHYTVYLYNKTFVPP